MYYISRIAAVLAFVTLLIAAWFSIRLARADADFRRHSPESVARAVELAPDNAEYLTFRALQLDYEGADSTPVLARVAVLNPLASAPRIRLGLAAEIRGDFDLAERWLLDAARVDRQFEPRWTLANYYFRRQNVDPFWEWMRLALEVSYSDQRPAFDLCWRVSASPPEILSRAIPDRREVTSAYLAYLLESGRLDAVLPVALKLADSGDPDDRPQLLAACDAFLDAGDAGAARALWLKLGYSAPSGLFNGNFESPRAGHGFDWRWIESPGVTHIALETPPAHRVTLSGRQPESCELLKQIVDLKPGARYTLRWEVRTTGLRTPSGLEWRIGDRRATIPSSDEWRSGEIVFVAAAELTPLVLAYQRPEGEARAEGSVEVSRVFVAAR